MPLPTWRFAILTTRRRLDSTSFCFLPFRRLRTFSFLQVRSSFIGIKKWPLCLFHPDTCAGVVSRRDHSCASVFSISSADSLSARSRFPVPQVRRIEIARYAYTGIAGQLIKMFYLFDVIVDILERFHYFAVRKRAFAFPRVRSARACQVSYLLLFPIICKMPPLGDIML